VSWRLSSNKYMKECHISNFTINWWTELKWREHSFSSYHVNGLYRQLWFFNLPCEHIACHGKKLVLEKMHACNIYNRHFWTRFTFQSYIHTPIKFLVREMHGVFSWWPIYPYLSYSCVHLILIKYPIMCVV
jgi:hypothetical protein